jgi:hypothetical protein
METPEGFGQTALSPEFGKGKPIIWNRTASGLQTNIRWRVRHHSPTGLEIGYPGSGPADLALNAMVALFPIQGKEEVAIWEGHVSRKAWDLHQPFKFAFLAAADRQSGRIEWAKIEAWIEENS